VRFALSAGRAGGSFARSAADRSGGYFTQINPDEPVAWRAFDLLATADLDLRGGKAWPEELVMEMLVARLTRLSR
jgi:hypothetical protein